MDLKEVKEKLLLFLLEKRITNKELSKKTKITYSLVTMIMRDKAKLSLKNLDKIILAYPEFESFIKGENEDKEADNAVNVGIVKEVFNDDATITKDVQKLNEFIYDRHLPLKEFAVRIGLSYSNLTKILRGDNTLTQKTIHRIVTVYPEFDSYLQNNKAKTTVQPEPPNDLLKELLDQNRELIRQNGELIKMLSTLQGEKKLTDTNHQGLQSSKSTEETMLGAAA